MPPPAPLLCRREEGQQAQPWLVTPGLCFDLGGHRWMWLRYCNSWVHYSPNTQLQTRTPPHGSLGVKGHQRGCPYSASADSCSGGWGGARWGVCAPPSSSPMLTCRTKLLEVVSDEVLPSERLKRLLRLLYLPCGEG